MSPPPYPKKIGYAGNMCKGKKEGQGVSYELEGNYHGN